MLLWSCCTAQKQVRLVSGDTHIRGGKTIVNSPWRGVKFHADRSFRKNGVQWIRHGVRKWAGDSLWLLRISDCRQTPSHAVYKMQHDTHSRVHVQTNIKEIVSAYKMRENLYVGLRPFTITWLFICKQSSVLLLNSNDKNNGIHAFHKFHKASGELRQTQLCMALSLRRANKM